MVTYTEYSGRALRSFFPKREDFQSAWANPDTCTEVLREPNERGIRARTKAVSQPRLAVHRRKWQAARE